MNHSNVIKEGIQVCIVNDNMYEWNVYLFGFEKNTKLAQDLKLFEKKTKKDKVKLQGIYLFFFKKIIVNL